MPTRKQLRNRKMHGFVFWIFALCVAVQMLLVAKVSGQAPVENDFIALLNTERTTLGKNLLTFNSNLSTAAYLHSKDMAEQGYFNHTSFDGRTFDLRIAAAGYSNYTSLAENIAYASGAANAPRVYDMWKNSPGHYTNMMGDFNDAGLGVYSKNGITYYTLDLGKSRVSAPPQIPELGHCTVLVPMILLTTLIAVRSRRKLSYSD